MEDKLNVPDTNVGDMISRRAAIDAIYEDADWLAAQGSDWQVARMERDKSILKSLPPVQPILTCDGCRYDGYYKHMRCRNCIRKERDLYEPE